MLVCFPFCQIFEISNDAKMKRTMNRPLPSGRIGVPHAVAWATIAGASGACLLASKVNVCFLFFLWLGVRENMNLIFCFHDKVIAD